MRMPASGRFDGHGRRDMADRGTDQVLERLKRGSSRFQERVRANEPRRAELADRVQDLRRHLLVELHVVLEGAVHGVVIPVYSHSYSDELS